MSVDLSDFLPAYLTEVEELLSAANAHLLSLETAVRQRSASPRTVRELFRALHTIKGLSAMVDVEPIVSIAHEMETVLRHADQAGGRLPEASIEPMMEGLRAIEQRVRQLAAGTPASEAPKGLLERLEGMEGPAGGGPRQQESSTTLQFEPALAAKLSASEREQLLVGVASGRRALRLDYVPSAEKAAQGFTINSVRERLGQLGEIIKVIPMAGATSGGGNLTFALLLLTSAEDSALLEVAGGPPAQVRPIASPSAAGSMAEPALPSEPLMLSEEGAAVEPRRSGVLRVEVSRLDDALERLAALVVSRSKLARAVDALTAAGVKTRELVQVLQENTRQLRDLRASILHLRMVRVGDVLERLPLLVRGLRRATGKLVRLELEVGDAELDKAVADRLLPAIVHLVRNAVDHALESPEERLAAGKPEEGVVRVACHARANGRLELTVSDDGRGVDAAAAAGRAGVPVPASSADLLELLCRPGLSTRASADATSGRGMGMDIVKRITVDQLGGELSLDTVPGKGTAFTPGYTMKVDQAKDMEAAIKGPAGAGASRQHPYLLRAPAGAFRYRAGGNLRGSPPAERRIADRDRFRWLCHRRACGRGADRGDVSGGGTGNAAAPGRSAPLPDGGGDTAEPAGMHRAGNRHVRLRYAHTQCP